MCVKDKRHSHYSHRVCTVQIRDQGSGIRVKERKTGRVPGSNLLTETEISVNGFRRGVARQFWCINFEWIEVSNIMSSNLRCQYWVVGVVCVGSW